MGLFKIFNIGKIKDVTKPLGTHPSPVKKSSGKLSTDSTDHLTTDEFRQVVGDAADTKSKHVFHTGSATPAENLYLNPFTDGEVMPCCGRKYCFSYHTMKYMPRNPKLKYRGGSNEGDIDHDPYSRNPGHVDYNNCREAIRQAKAQGYNHIHWRLSVATSEAIRKDGYKDHNHPKWSNKYDIISW